MVQVSILPSEHVRIVQSIGLSKQDEEKILWCNGNELFSLDLGVGVGEGSQ
jgi:hypothetical protein